MVRMSGLISNTALTHCTGHGFFRLRPLSYNPYHTHTDTHMHRQVLDLSHTKARTQAPSNDSSQFCTASDLASNRTQYETGEAFTSY